MIKLLTQSFAGVLTGVWPCGIITTVTELFGAESVSQVYATLHTFLHQNHDSLTDLGIYNHTHKAHNDMYTTHFVLFIIITPCQTH